MAKPFFEQPHSIEILDRFGGADRGRSRDSMGCHWHPIAAVEVAAIHASTENRRYWLRAVVAERLNKDI